MFFNFQTCVSCWPNHCRFSTILVDIVRFDVAVGVADNVVAQDS